MFGAPAQRVGGPVMSESLVPTRSVGTSTGCGRRPPYGFFFCLFPSGNLLMFPDLKPSKLNFWVAG